MKPQKILLDIEDDDEEITLGLVRVAKEVPHHELFYHLNNLNSFQFSRISDLVYRGNYFDYSFPRYQGFHSDSKICVQFIANRSSQNFQKKMSAELFFGEQETKFLIDHFQDVDYLLRTSEPFGDFSLILLPENLMFPIQSFPLQPDAELYQIIQYYD